MTDTEMLSTTEVRKVLKKAGVPFAKKFVSKNIRGGHGFSGRYTSVTASGVELKRETDYRQKQHVPTGRVLMTFLANELHNPRAKDDQASHRELATKALSEAGYTVTEYTATTLAVSR